MHREHQVRIAADELRPGVPRSPSSSTSEHSRRKGPNGSESHCRRDGVGMEPRPARRRWIRIGFRHARTWSRPRVHSTGCPEESPTPGGESWRTSPLGRAFHVKHTLRNHPVRDVPRGVRPLFARLRVLAHRTPSRALAAETSIADQPSELATATTRN